MAMASVKSEPGTRLHSSSFACYTYSPLAENAIRLVKLYPFKPEDGPRGNRATPVSTICIDLVYTSLQDAPTFYAISYTWGDSQSRHHILVDNDKTIAATENVGDILGRLRPEADDEPRLYWIDQLCINQNDQDERWSQIRMMRHIYGKAYGTLICLAGDAKIHDATLLLLGAADHARSAETTGSDLPRNMTGSLLARTPGQLSVLYAWSSDSIPDQIKALFSHSDFRSRMLSIIQNPVFRRAWIYQEIVSSSSVHLVASALSLSWTVFARAFELYCRLEAEDPGRSMARNPSFAAIDLIVRDRIGHLNGRIKDWSLLHTQAQGILLASDPKDNTIALTTFQDFYMQITPYNNMYVAELYLASANAMVSASRSLDIFGALSGKWHNPLREIEGMPSWVPDWSKARGALPFYWPQEDTPFNAAKGYQHDPSRGLNGPRGEILQSLHVQGKKIEEICFLSGPHFENLEKDLNLDQFLRLEHHGASWLHYTETRGCPLVQERTFETCKPIARALMKAMTASFTRLDSFTSENIVAIPPDEIYDELVFMVAWYDLIMSGETIYHQGKPHSLSFMPRTWGSWKKAMAKLRQWVSICSGRRIVFGEKQGFGLVPKKATEGDIVCILHGSKVPIVLRRLGRVYRVIGQCYWHDWMDGEKVHWAEDEADSFLLI
jgi:hypothetical protein